VIFFKRWPVHTRRRFVRVVQRGVVVALAGVTTLATPAIVAQQRPVASDTISTAYRDSLAVRLARAEAAIELLRKQLAIESSTQVRTRSRIQLELSARIITNTFATNQRVNNVDVPQFALAPLAPVSPPGTGAPVATAGTRILGLSVRQSRVGAAISVDSVLGGTFEGDFEMDFYGGVSNGPGDRRLFPEPRLRVARAQLRWNRTTVLIGSETPLISDLNPISVASIGVPLFATAGNLWNWLPQVRVSRDIIVTSSGVRVGLQGALLTPFTGVQNGAETDAADAGERSGRPFVQSRLNVRWGEGAERSGAPSDVAVSDNGGEIGVGVHRGWVRVDGDSNRISSAVSLDARVSLHSRIELRAEAYRGTLIRGLGGAAVGQSFGRTILGQPNSPSLRDQALWVQLNSQLHPTLIAGAGCGTDHVTLADRPTRIANTVCAAHALWRPAQPVFVGLEFRRLATRYDAGTSRANHINLAFGFEL
jgi:hypothetical protein